VRDVAHLPSPTLNIGHPNRISLQKRPDPVVLGTSDTLKLTFQVTEQTTENGVQPHQTFLRFFDSTTGEEGIQPVKVTPSGKAKFELVRFRLRLFVVPSVQTYNVSRRTWRNLPAPSRPLEPPRCASPFFSAHSCIALPLSTSSTFKSRRPRLPPCIQTSLSTSRAQSLHTPSALTRNYPPASSRPSLPRSSLPRGPSFLVWYVYRLFDPGSYVSLIVLSSACGL